MYSYKIKENCARLDGNEKTIFISKNIEKHIKDMDYYIRCIFINSKTNKISRELIYKKNNIISLNFDHTSKHYKNSNYVVSGGAEGWWKSNGDLYDILIGKWVDSADYDKSEAHIVFSSNKDKAKFIMKLNSEYHSNG